MKLTNAQLKAFDEWLFDYQVVDKKIAERKLEIQTQHEYDDNVGGGRSSNIAKVTEELVVKWNCDGRIKALESFKKAVQETFDVLDDELKSIFNLRWGIGSCNTWEEISCKTHISRPQVYRKRERILTLFAEKIGK